jgi:hypothetical protein
MPNTNFSIEDAVAALHGAEKGRATLVANLKEVDAQRDVLLTQLNELGYERDSILDAINSKKSEILAASEKISLLIKAEE